MNLRLDTIADCLQLTISLQRPDHIITEFLTDSRSLHVADRSFFFALRTESNDGHRYVASLYEQGMRQFVVASQFDTTPYADADFFPVEDVLVALQTLGAHERRNYSSPILAITGSNGKTIVKEWLWQMLRQQYVVSRSPRSYNSQIGVPLSLSMLDETSSLAILEAGISQPGEMAVLQSIVSPDYGLFTNLGEAHQEHFSSMQEKLQEKLCLFSTCKALCYCADDPMVSQTVDNCLGRLRLYAWSVHDPSARIFFRVNSMPNKTSVRTLWRRSETEFTLPYADAVSVQNALHVLAGLIMLEEEQVISMESSLVAHGLKHLEPVAMRLEVKAGQRQCVLIDDSYNADLKALEMALDFQSNRQTDSHLQRSLILSDIDQSGRSADDLYADVAALLQRQQLSRLVGIGPALSEHAHCFSRLPSASFFLSTEAFLASPIVDDFQRELVLIKGSRRFGFERISRRLSWQSHQTVMEVNLSALVHNYNYFRSLLKHETKLIAMVKAEAYGLGALEVSKTLQAHRCDALAVAVADEGVRLRQGGISLPIMVMNPEPSVFALCCDYRLEPEVYSFELLDAFLEQGESMGSRHYPIHLKFDTGMHRLGFSQEDIPEIVQRLSKSSALSVSSVFTHLAGSDEDRFDDYTNIQWQSFDQIYSQLQQALPYAIERHILNSAGIERFPQWQCDRVRLGIGLYGISVCHPEHLQAVATLKTTILQIHRFKKGDTIGYSRTVVLERDSLIATLPIGYADGFNRHNRNQEVLVNGQRCRVVGNICMDVCMIDVTDVSAKVGDTVIIFGEGLPVSEVAERLDTIPYEVLTSVSNRVRRIYYQD